MPLEQELKTYNDKLPEMHEHEGKYVLIHGADLVDYFETYEDAIKEGYQKFGLEPFLVKRVNTTEQIQFISRLVAAQPIGSL